MIAILEFARDNPVASIALAFALIALAGSFVIGFLLGPEDERPPDAS